MVCLMVMLVLFGTVVEHVHDEAREPVPLVSPSEYEQLLPIPAAQLSCICTA